MTYSIAELEQLSGVTAHTIRIWERRYNALDPMRTAGNTRFYDDNQLRRLLNIVSLNQSGLKISNVCALNENEINILLQKEIDQNSTKNTQFEYYISQIISNGFCYNEQKVDQLLTKCFAEYGLLQSYRNIIYPLLVRLGLMWRKDSICPSQEHFLSCIIRQKIFAAINNLSPDYNSKSTWLLFLPEDEDHDIGLLLANYMLREAKHKVIYLGAKVPIESVKNAMQSVDADNILLFMTRLRPLTEASNYLDELYLAFNKSKIFVSGNSKLISEIDMNNKFTWLQNLNDFEQTINKLS